MSFECEFCHKNFATVSSLNLHKKTTKKCLKIQADLTSNQIVLNFLCEYCNKEFSLKHHFESHNETCKEKLKTKEKQSISELLILKDELIKYEQERNKEKQLIKQLQEENETIKKNYEQIKLELSEHKTKLQCKDEEIKRLQELAKKPTTTNNYNCNNKYELKVAFDKLTPFTKENIIRSLRQCLQSKSLKEGEDSFSSDLNKSLEDKVIITDMSRGKAIVKSEAGIKKNTTAKKVIKDVFKYGKDVILENCEIALDELQENDTHNFNKDHCNQTNYIRQVKNTVNQSMQNKNTEITKSLGNKIDLILE